MRISISDYLIKTELKEGEEVLINPLIDPSVLLKRVERRVVYNPRLREYHEVTPKKYVFPVYLPEIGILLSLNTVSENLARKLYDEAKDYEGIKSKGKLFLCKIHNFQKDENSIVSWGTLKPFELDNDRILNIYLFNILNDFYLTSSIIINDMLISPNRWFFMSSKSPYKFETFINYNFGVIYLKKEKLNHKKTEKVWIDAILRLYKVMGYFVYFQPNGFVNVRQIPLYFTDDPKDNLIFENFEGDYFLSFIISFNNYSTSCDKVSIKSGNINLVEVLTELVYSPYEILPLLFPLFVEDNVLNNLFYSFTVRKEVFKKILSRLTKFGRLQNSMFLSAFDEFVKKRNKLLNIREEAENYWIEIVNPAIVPFLIRKLVTDEIVQIKKEILKILEEQIVLEKMKLLNKSFLEKQQWLYNLELRPLRGIDLDPRINVLRKYLLFYRKNLI